MRLGRDVLARDLYALLDLPTGASATDVRRAYRRLVRESHPDLNPTDDAAEERMARLNVAAAVLLDPTVRAVYDRHRGVRDPGRAATRGSRGASPKSTSVDWESVPTSTPPARHLTRELSAWLRGLHPWPARPLVAFDRMLRRWPPERQGTMFVVALLLGVGLIAYAGPSSLNFWCAPDCPPPPAVAWRVGER